MHKTDNMIYTDTPKNKTLVLLSSFLALLVSLLITLSLIALLH